MNPEQALEAARERAASHAQVTIPVGGLEVEQSSEPTDGQLLQWSVVEPDLREVRSTRPGPIGRVVTAIKQGLLRMLGQYHAQVLSVQNRINVHLSLRSTVTRDELRELQTEVEGMRRRIEDLEGVVGRADTDTGSTPNADPEIRP